MLNVTVPATIKSDFTITGTLLTNDGEAIANASIWIEKSNTHASIKQTTTDNNGEFSVNIPASQLSTGSNSLRVGFTNTDYYTSSVQNVTVTKVVPESLSLTSDKSILSYNDTESAILTATVTGSDSNPYSGATVIMRAYKVSDDSFVDALTVVDNGDGTYSGTYVSGGVGDIYIKAECNLVSKRYAIQDCNYANDLTSSDGHWTIPSSANASYSSNGMKLQGSSWSDCFLNIEITKPSSIEYDITDYGGDVKYQNYLWDSNKANRRFHMWFNNSSSLTIFDYYNSSANSINYTIPTGSHIKVNVKADSLELYVDDVLKITKSNYTMDSTFIFGLATGTSRSTTYKNLKIKPL